MSFGYFDTDDQGRFIHDIRLGLDIKTFSVREHKLYSIPARKSGSSYRQIPDKSIDLREIPPSLFLVSVINAYSRGFDWHVPTDISFENFSIEMGSSAKNFLADVPLGHNKGRQWRIFNDYRKFLVQINDTGILESVLKWNILAFEKGDMWCHHHEYQDKYTILSCISDCIERIKCQN